MTRVLVAKDQIPKLFTHSSQQAAQKAGKMAESGKKTNWMKHRLDIN